MGSLSSFRVFVTQRAGSRCEYCGLSQLGQEATFHIDHVIPVAANRPTEVGNFALACVSCSLSKSARLSAIDPETKTSVAIFNPRQQQWSEHFRWDDVKIIGLTATGRATIVALRLNRPVILAIRAEERLLGRHPPSPQ